ncbi:sulfotransferase domain-containing protein [Stappia sp. F7233]|uniref:Sulfotransferase domain-containing protein n=1 Tax=Stappia albiluteola TaxID=2758565 RepID=A0A839AGN9_9HYPH|nr:sulfotransferase domain-containing protein [Stappia albiluteola]MBA5778052.1 sulfotransferase domain-containing protein [Stappia albiluteola]
MKVAAPTSSARGVMDVEHASGPDYASAPNCIVFFGHHKCASRLFRAEIFTRIARKLGARVRSYKIKQAPFRFGLNLDDLDLQNIDFANIGRDGSDVIMFSNSTVRSLARIKSETDNWKGVRIIRDPRQVLVSDYFHHKVGHKIEGTGWVWEQLKQDKPVLLNASKEDGILHELDNISRVVIEDQVLGEFDDERILNIKPEDFSRDPHEYLQRIFKFLGIPEVEGIDLSRTFANSESGPWQEHFTDRIREIFKTRYGRALIDIGYERDLNW